MSITGPGCERCNKGLVNWQEQPYVRERDGLDYKPCDHCGGLSQLSCPRCGQPTECTKECEEHAAARAREADAIVRELAKTSPFYDHNGCSYCGHRVHSDGSDPHADDCIYLRSRAYVGTR